VTVKLDRRDPVFLQQDNFSEASPNVARDLAAVLRISTAINGIKKAEELQRRVLDMMFEVLPIERGAILLNGHHSDEFVSGVYRDRVSDVSEPFRISRSIARQVLRDGVAVIANDVLNDQQFLPTESIVAPPIRSLLCVPLLAFGAKFGVIYARRHPSRSSTGRAPSASLDRPCLGYGRCLGACALVRIAGGANKRI